MANMAEAEDNVLEDTQQPHNCETLQKNGAEEKNFGGVGSTATSYSTETPKCRKRLGGSSPGKVQICYPLNICFLLSVMELGLNGLPDVANFIVQFIPSTCVVNVRSLILNFDIHITKLVGRI